MADQNLEKYTNTNPLQQFFLRRFFKKIRKLFKKIGEKTSVLDVGCGEGFTIRTLKALSPNSTFVGVDTDKKALAYAQERDAPTTYVEASIFALPFPDKSFDLILCNEVLEHLDNPGKALRELRRVTKKYILVSVPHEPLFRLSNLIRGRNISRLGNYPFHLQTWTKRKFVNFIETEFRVIEVCTPFPWTVLLAEKK